MRPAAAALETVRLPPEAGRTSTFVAVFRWPHRSDDSAQSWVATGYEFDGIVPSDNPPLLVDVPQSTSGVLSDRGVWEALLPSDRIFEDAGR